jgi:hypothetical protein
MESCKCRPDGCNPSGNRVPGYRCAEDEEFVADQRQQMGTESFAISMDDDQACCYGLVSQKCMYHSALILTISTSAAISSQRLGHILTTTGSPVLHSHTPPTLTQWR